MIESRWDETSRVHELAYSDYLASLCDCGAPIEVCMDRNRAWLVDFRIGYRCQAMMQVQSAKAKEDERVIKAGGRVYPDARKWMASEFHDFERETPDGGEDSPG